jgi:hypothetical protein
MKRKNGKNEDAYRESDGPIFEIGQNDHEDSLARYHLLTEGSKYLKDESHRYNHLNSELSVLLSRSGNISKWYFSHQILFLQVSHGVEHFNKNFLKKLKSFSGIKKIIFEMDVDD